MFRRVKGLEASRIYRAQDRALFLVAKLIEASIKYQPAGGGYVFSPQLSNKYRCRAAISQVEDSRFTNLQAERS